MLLQTIRRSLRRWFALPRPTCHFRPCLEPFEDRCLPSLLLVSNLKDAGVGSLRQKINKANATPAADTIEFAAGLKGTIRLTSGQLRIHEELTIRGPGAARLAVSGNNNSSVLYVAPTAKVKISNLTIRDGKANFGGGLFNDGKLLLKKMVLVENSALFMGGAVHNRGQLQITHSKLANNSADQGGAVGNQVGATAIIAQTTVTNNLARLLTGGGITNSGSMSISTSTISFNKSVSGGGIYSSGTLTVIACTLIGNFSSVGGGIFSSGASSASTTLINSTIVNNTSTGANGGGGVRAGAGSLTVASCTITGNVDASIFFGSAGGIYCASGVFFTLNNSVVAENYAHVASIDVNGAIKSGSGNLIGIGTVALTGISNGINGNQIGTDAAPRDPKLGPLENNGGPTLTRVPRPGSPLINKGVNAALFGLATDQRGRKRIWGGIVDIGAVEFGA